MAELSDLELLSELGVDTAPEAQRTFTPRQERIIAGFEDIQKFAVEHGRLPQHGDDRDTFERLYAVRLDQLRSLQECRELLTAIDTGGILSAAPAIQDGPTELADEDLLKELGVQPDPASDITILRNVTTRAEKRAAEEIANREKCTDFEQFKPLFEAIQADLASGARVTKPIIQTEVTLAEIQPGGFFIVGGQLAYIVDATDEFITQYERKDRRLRVIYDNATESNVLARSFQKALYRDDTSRRVIEPEAGPLFGNAAENDDLGSGTIYVLRSHSTHPYVAKNRELIHKIGVTGQTVEARIANAASDPTFLLADVEVIATYKLYNINRSRLEGLIHRALAAAQIELSTDDRFGKAVQPREWFLVPLPKIDELVDKISDGSITNFRYDPARADFIEI